MLGCLQSENCGEQSLKVSQLISELLVNGHLVCFLGNVYGVGLLSN